MPKLRSSFLTELGRHVKDGTLKDIWQNWKWILSFSRGKWANILLYTFMGMGATALSAFTALISKGLIDAISVMDTSRLFRQIPALILCGLLSMALQGLSSRIAAKIHVDAQNHVRQQLFDQLLCSQWESVLRFSTGDLINRFSTDVQTIASCSSVWLPKVIIQCFTALLTLCIVCYYDPFMALIFLISTPVLMVSSQRLVSKQLQQNRKLRELSGTISSFESESLRNFETLKSFGTEKLLSSALSHHQNQYRAAALEHNLFAIRTNVWMNAAGSVVQYITLGYCLWRLWNGQILWGTLVLFLQQYGTLSSAFSSLISLIPSALSGSVAAERIRELTDLEKEPSAQPIQCSSCSLTIQNISSGYRDKNQVLTDISLSVHPGETVALIGASGEGKTTLLRLILGLISPSTGSITLTDQSGDTHPVGPQTRQCFAYVPQGNTMMAASIADNLRLGRPDATREEMMESLRIACADSFVSDLPQGLDTILSEGGKGISQGQSQRLSIARALLKKAPILLMDEATSDLDPDTQQQLLKNLSALDLTCILTTHRTSVLDQCTRVYRIQNNRLTLIDEIDR